MHPNNRSPYYFDPKPPLPPQVPPAPALIRADCLTPANKRRVWDHIKRHDPNTLAFLTDPTVAALLQRPGAVAVFPKALVDAALAAQPEATTP